MSEPVELPPTASPRRRAPGAADRALRRRVVAALGEHRCAPLLKDDVIGYLVLADWKPAEREELYRAWCDVVGVDVRRSDVSRVRNGRVRETIRSLDFGDPDEH